MPRITRSTLLPAGRCNELGAFTFGEVARGNLDAAPEAIKICNTCPLLPKCQAHIASIAMKLSVRGSSVEVVGGELVRTRAPRPDLPVICEPLPFEDPAAALSGLRRFLQGDVQLSSKTSTEAGNHISALGAQFTQEYPAFPLAALKGRFPEAIRMLGRGLLKHEVLTQPDAKWHTRIEQILPLAHAYLSDTLTLTEEGFTYPARTAIRNGPAHLAQLYQQYEHLYNLTPGRFRAICNLDFRFPQLALEDYGLRLNLYSKQFENDPRIDKKVLQELCRSTMDIGNSLQRYLRAYQELSNEPGREHTHHETLRNTALRTT